jgi:hypothetical protein
MSFLDNLEDNLKNLEGREERDPEQAKRAAEQRESERARARAAQPWAERLRKGPFTQELLSEATRIGHGLRTKVYISWIGPALRLDARDRRMELRPASEGVIVDFFENGRLSKRRTIDLEGSAAQLAEEWLGGASPRTD